MKFLFDTNIIISAEPTSQQNSEAKTANVSKLIGLIGQLNAQCYVHPASFSEITGDRDENRRALRQTLLSKYSKLEAPPNVTSDMLSSLGSQRENSHNAIDMKILAALVGNAADFLVTEDNGIHHWAARLGIQDLVLTIDDALVLVRGLLPRQVQMPPAVELVKCYQLRAKDSIFDTLRQDYPGFDNWLTKCQKEHRPAFLIRGDGRHAAVAIIKYEETTDVEAIEKALKICTFKVAETSSGFRYGELLLRAIFDYVHAQNIEQTYLTCYPKQTQLMRFLERFGFDMHITLENNELVFTKRFVPSETDSKQLSALTFHIKYGPYRMKMDQAEKFVIPIQSTYHKMLFPNAEKQLSLLAGSEVCGNSILKAYLCKSAIKSLPAGSLALFYRSQDASSVQIVGVVDRCLRSSDANEIVRFVGKRTVYSFQEIEAMCAKETLVILFRYAKEVNPVSLRTLIRNNVIAGPPQQITRVKSGSEQWIRDWIES